MFQRLPLHIRKRVVFSVLQLALKSRHWTRSTSLMCCTWAAVPLVHHTSSSSTSFLYVQFNSNLKISFIQAFAVRHWSSVDLSEFGEYTQSTRACVCLGCLPTYYLARNKRRQGLFSRVVGGHCSAARLSSCKGSRKRKWGSSLARAKEWGWTVQNKMQTWNPSYRSKQKCKGLGWGFCRMTFLWPGCMGYYCQAIVDPTLFFLFVAGLGCCVSGAKRLCPHAVNQKIETFSSFPVWMNVVQGQILSSLLNAAVIICIYSATLCHCKEDLTGCVPGELPPKGTYWILWPFLGGMGVGSWPCVCISNLQLNSFTVFWVVCL